MGVGAIGAIAVADSDPNVIYVGTGSAAPRGNISNGDGMYVSTDAGKTWRHSGLKDAGQIGKIRVHPTNPDVAWAAVLGNIFGPNEERGIYRTQDGGATWDKVLYPRRAHRLRRHLDRRHQPTHPLRRRLARRAQALDPDLRRRRAAASGRRPTAATTGPSSRRAARRSDRQDRRHRLARQPDRVWAVIEADQSKGGVYRSDDAGESWRR